MLMDLLIDQLYFPFQSPDVSELHKTHISRKSCQCSEVEEDVNLTKDVVAKQCQIHLLLM